jgi:hypothetical protein
MKQKQYLWLLSMVVVTAGTWLTFLLSDLETLRSFNARFESTTNKTNRPDYEEIGLIVHMNDMWADVEVWRRGRNSGFISASYIRRDISRQHNPPIFFFRKRINDPLVPDESRGTGVILGINDGFVPLCFFVRDAWSGSRNIFGCGGYYGQNFGANFGPRTKADWDSHFNKYGFDAPPLLLATEQLGRVPLSNVYDDETGIESCSLYAKGDYGALELDLFDNPWTQCAFGINKEAFAVGLSISRDRIPKYNELIVKEWSEMPNPVDAIFYVRSGDESLVSSSEAAQFRDYALGIRSQYFFSEGRVLPVFTLNLDAFFGDGKSVLEYSYIDNFPGSLTFGFTRESESLVK